MCPEAKLRNIPPRRLLLASLAFASVLAAVAVYGFGVEPRRVTVTKVPITQGALATVLAGRTAVLLSDLHFSGKEGERFDRILRALEKIKPDLVFLAGDYVRWNSREPAYEHAIAFFSRLNAPLGVYAVLGDADMTHPRKSCEFCHEPGGGTPTRRHGVTFLRDELVTVRTPSGEVAIAGVSGEGGEEEESGTPFISGKLFEGGLPVILLAHSSRAYYRIDASREALVLSGDTHGGQVRLPARFWRVVKRKPDPAHVYGFYRDGRKSLFVTRGLGTSWPHLRLGEPPEIVVLEFGR